MCRACNKLILQQFAARKYGPSRMCQCAYVHLDMCSWERVTAGAQGSGELINMVINTYLETLATPHLASAVWHIDENIINILWYIVNAL